MTASSRKETGRRISVPATMWQDVFLLCAESFPVALDSIIHHAENKAENENLVIDEIIVDKDSKKEILKDLKLMKIHSDTVYPDLERTAIYLRNKKLGWKNFEE